LFSAYSFGPAAARQNRCRGAFHQQYFKFGFRSARHGNGFVENDDCGGDSFMLSALFISMPALQGNVSVLNANPDAATESTQPPITDLNSNTDANSAATNVSGDANSSVTIQPAEVNANSASANANK
jgi:hypothetical protein